MPGKPPGPSRDVLASGFGQAPDILPGDPVLRHQPVHDLLGLDRNQSLSVASRKRSKKSRTAFPRASNEAKLPVVKNAPPVRRSGSK
jgi:hypothetical protein